VSGAVDWDTLVILVISHVTAWGFGFWFAYELRRQTTDQVTPLKERIVALEAEIRAKEVR